MKIIRLAAIALLALLAACAQDQVILLPGEDGAPVGSVAILDLSGKEQAVLDTAYTDARLSGSSTEKKLIDAGAVEKQFGPLLAALPRPPAHYRLYFREGTTTLVPRSEPTLDELLKDAGTRPGADVQVTGHTDTVGRGDDNDALSLDRAKLIRRLLIQRGLDPGLVRAVGRGERAPLVQTGDNVRHADNRRVEVTVR